MSGFGAHYLQSSSLIALTFPKKSIVMQNTLHKILQKRSMLQGRSHGEKHNPCCDKNGQTNFYEYGV